MGLPGCTWWLVTFCAAGFALLVFLGIWLRLRRVRRDLRRLEALSEKQAVQLRDSAERLKDLSLTDPLTGLRNRRYLRELIGAEVARVRRVHEDYRRHPEQERALEKAFLGFVLLDIDHFKDINDSHGHEAGDALIRGYAERLSQTLRGEDAVIRWGGEEFLVVCREVSPGSLLALCGRVAEKLKESPFRLPGGREIGCTSSVGFATFPFVAADPDLFGHETVINLADHAMYVGKRSGRDLVVGIAPGERPIDAEVREWVKRDLRRGVDEGYLRLLVSGERELAL